MPGVGKSTLGHLLAQTLNFKFIDPDVLIQRKTHLSLQAIMDIYGEARLVALEEEVICDLDEVHIQKAIIAPGGSAVYSAKAMDMLRKNSLIVYLEDTFESISKRISNADTRGIIGLKEKGLERLYQERHELYTHYADIVIVLPEKFNTHAIQDLILKKVATYERRPESL